MNVRKGIYGTGNRSTNHRFYYSTVGLPTFLRRIMSTIKENIANNIIELRKLQGWTQAELAEKLNFTDKTISKWERGESTPDVESLAAMAKLFHLTVDELMSETVDKNVIIEKNKWTITKDMAKLALGIVAIWLLGTGVFVYGTIDGFEGPGLWMSFIWPTPVSCLLVMIVSFVRKIIKAVPFAASATLWTFITAIYLQWLVFGENFWIIFTVGVPLQLIIIITYWINKK